MYRSLLECVLDLEKNGFLLRIGEEVDPHLEMAEIHRQVHDKAGPALFFEKVKGSPFPAVSNLFGTWERTQFIFRKTLQKTTSLVALKAHPEILLQNILQAPGMAMRARRALPKKTNTLPSLYAETSIDQLPAIKSWPDDGGAFITLPQVLSLPPGSRSIMQSNIGMYRIQLDGNDYRVNEEIGLHYQIHRGIGVHHKQYLDSEEDFRVSIFIGGPPAHSVAAIMPLPEGMSETTFMGLLAGRRFHYGWRDGYVISADADFVITGTIDKSLLKPEGPFGDHLGYYSLQHPFPVMKVHQVWHRRNAIWPFTVVGRPPQEDSQFGHLIHHIVRDLTPSEFPGLRSLHAVDASGVHPLLLAVGQERYMPFRDRRPEELLTIANHLLGKGQTSLAKFLLICDDADRAGLEANDIPSMFRYVLERFRPERDLHFYTNWTIDTLDYSGHGWNAGSKLVIAAAGDKIRELGDQLEDDLSGRLPFPHRMGPIPGILLIQAGVFESSTKTADWIRSLEASLAEVDMAAWPLIVICDDADFVADHLNNFLWVTFTRSNPASDVYGIQSFIENKHWGCRGPLILDARSKPWHAPPLIADPDVAQKAERILASHSI